MPNMTIPEPIKEIIQKIQSEWEPLRDEKPLSREELPSYTKETGIRDRRQNPQTYYRAVSRILDFYVFTLMSSLEKTVNETPEGDQLTAARKILAENNDALVGPGLYLDDQQCVPVFLPQEKPPLAYYKKALLYEALMKEIILLLMRDTENKILSAATNILTCQFLSGTYNRAFYQKTTLAQSVIISTIIKLIPRRERVNTITARLDEYARTENLPREYKNVNVTCPTANKKTGSLPRDLSALSPQELDDLSIETRHKLDTKEKLRGRLQQTMNEYNTPTAAVKGYETHASKEDVRKNRLVFFNKHLTKTEEESKSCQILQDLLLEQRLLREAKKQLNDILTLHAQKNPASRAQKLQKIIAPIQSLSQLEGTLMNFVQTGRVGYEINVSKTLPGHLRHKIAQHFFPGFLDNTSNFLSPRLFSSEKEIKTYSILFNPTSEFRRSKTEPRAS